VSPPDYEILETARALAGMSLDELWLAYMALGGNASPDLMRAYLQGTHTEPVGYDILAHALNEEFVDQGSNHPVPYADELD
jgi:hypothetical protein